MNNDASAGPQRSVSVVEESVEEGTAESIQLSASFTPSEDMSYEYDISDLRDIVSSPPAYVKITQVPQHGKIVVQ